MATKSTAGSDWTDDELDAIVADYFEMLALELAGQRYVKARHSEALMQALGRSHRSVEFKHMNISAVMSNLGRPIIKGYRPLYNIQRAIYDAIDRYLTRNPQTLELAPALLPTPALSESFELYEEAAPTLRAQRVDRAPRMQALVRKYDPSLRDFRNRKLGEAGERLVYETEIARLKKLGCTTLAKDVRWVSKEDGDGAGYDIRSFEQTGEERLIEVKTTYGGQTTPFFLTRNEHAVSQEKAETFRIFRLYDFADTPKLFKLQPPLAEAVRLDIETYRASF